MPERTTPEERAMWRTMFAVAPGQKVYPHEKAMGEAIRRLIADLDARDREESEAVKIIGRMESLLDNTECPGCSGDLDWKEWCDLRDAAILAAAKWMEERGK